MSYLRSEQQTSTVRAFCRSCQRWENHRLSFQNVMPDDPTFSGHYVSLYCLGDAHDTDSPTWTPGGVTFLRDQDHSPRSAPSRPGR